MATISQPAPVPLNKAIDLYFDLSLYLLVLTGFGTLASTGGLDFWTVVLVGLGLAIRGLFLAQRKKIVISQRWTTPLSIAYFIFFAIDYFAISRSFLPATVHLALFAAVVRMFSLRRERDHVTMAILAFLMVLASAVLTVDSLFLLFFSFFMLMAVVTFVLMEMRRSGKVASIRARHSADPMEHRHLALALARVAPALMVLILVGASGVFFVLPRMSAGYLGAYSFGTDLSTGFSDHVQLGGIGRIQQSNVVVMHVQIEGDTTGRGNLRWRGVALSNFDGRNWWNPHDAFVLSPQYGGAFNIPPFGTYRSSPAAVLPAGAPTSDRLRYRVLMEPIGTNVFFLAPWPRKIFGNYRAVSVDQGAAVYDMDVQHPVSRYEAESESAAFPPEVLRKAGKDYPPQVAPRYLQLPRVDPRILQLAEQITDSAPTSFDKAAALEKYLKTRYGYTLQLPRTLVNDPLADFLFVRKQGHCEYFASAMAVMLRLLGIPARVVNGFRSDEFNDITGNYVVRAKDAHSWVEAYFPGYGWRTFDPTPAGNGGASQPLSRLGLYLDAASSFWREWIISYDASHQYVLGQEAATRTRGILENTRAWARHEYAKMLGWARHTRTDLQRAPQKWMFLALLVALLAISAANARTIVRLFVEARLRRQPERTPNKAAAMWYGRMTRLLGRKGWNKGEAQTPAEFVALIEDPVLRAQVERFTNAYQSARFGDSQVDARKLPQLYAEVKASVDR